MIGMEVKDALSKLIFYHTQNFLNYHVLQGKKKSPMTENTDELYMEMVVFVCKRTIKTLKIRKKAESTI